MPTTRGPPPARVGTRDMELWARSVGCPVRLSGADVRAGQSDRSTPVEHRFYAICGDLVCVTSVASEYGQICFGMPITHRFQNTKASGGQLQS